MTPTTGASIGFALLLLLLAGSMPVGFVMAAVGLAGFALMVSPSAAFSMATIDLYTTFSDYNLTTIPLFWLASFARQRRIAYRGDWARAARRGLWVAALAGGLVLLRLEGLFQPQVALFLVALAAIAEVTLSTRR